MPKTKSITGTERLQLIGLLTLAKRHNAAIADIAEAARTITGEPADGHTDDAVFSDSSVEDLLMKLHITVTERIL